MEYKSKGLSHEEKFNLMSEYLNKTGQEIKKNTVYKGYKIGVMQNNLRQQYYNGILNMDKDLLTKFIEIGVIKEEKERKRMTQQEKYEFLMSLAELSPKARRDQIAANGWTYDQVRTSVQQLHIKGKLELTKEQIENLRKNKLLNYSREEKKEMSNRYGLPAIAVIRMQEYRGSVEEFIEAYL